MSNASVGASLTADVMKQDLPAIVSHYSSDAIVISPHGTFTGRDEIGAFFDGWFQPFSAPEIVETHKLEDGTLLMVEAVNTFDHIGPIESLSGETIAPTGKRVTVKAMEAYVIEDGLITEHRFYYDRLELLEQLGAGGARSG